jgi:hypothetical protein
MVPYNRRKTFLLFIPRERQGALVAQVRGLLIQNGELKEKLKQRIKFNFIYSIYKFKH